MALPFRRTSDDRTGSDSSVVARWEPFAELDRLHGQLGTFLDGFRMPDLLGDGPRPFTPLADVEETPHAYLVEIELPGVKRDHVDIEIAGRRVTVHGERKEKERVGFLRKRERTVGRFHYEVTLPGDVDDDHVDAQLDEGVLTVRLPKPESHRPRRIEIR